MRLSKLIVPFACMSAATIAYAGSDSMHVNSSAAYPYSARIIAPVDRIRPYQMSCFIQKANTHAKAYLKFTYAADSSGNTLVGRGFKLQNDKNQKPTIVNNAYPIQTPIMGKKGQLQYSLDPISGGEITVQCFWK